MPKFTCSLISLMPLHTELFSPVMSNFLNFLFSGFFSAVNWSQLPFWSRKSLLNYPCRSDGSFICF